MANVTFRGNSIISDSEGVWRFTPGIMQRNWVFVPLPLGLGELAKDMGLSGTDHKLTVTHLNVETADVGSVLDYYRMLMAPATGSPLSGSLVVPEYGTYPHCVLSGVVPGEQTARAKGISPTDPIGTKVYDMTFELTFRQLRR